MVAATSLRNLFGTMAASARPRILFFGSDVFASRHLQHLLDSQAGIVDGVVVAKSMNCDTLASLVSAHGLQMHRANTNFTMDDWLMPSGQFDLGVIVSFGYKIPSRIISEFPLGMINVHPSLLPSYRGASPIQSALLNKETRTGVCVIDIDPDVIDSGRILSRRETDILPDDTFLTLRDRLAEIGSEILAHAVANLGTARGGAVVQAAGAGVARLAPKLTKYDARVDCVMMTGDDIYTVYRALYGYMTISCAWRDKRLLLLQLEPVRKNRAILEPGDIIYDYNSDRLVLGCRSRTCLAASRVRIDTRKSVTPLAFAHGYHLRRTRL